MDPGITSFLYTLHPFLTGEPHTASSPPWSFAPCILPSLKLCTLHPPLTAVLHALLNTGVSLPQSALYVLYPFLCPCPLFYSLLRSRSASLLCRLTTSSKHPDMHVVERSDSGDRKIGCHPSQATNQSHLSWYFSLSKASES